MLEIERIDGRSTSVEKVFARFDSRVSPEPNSGCWLWMGPYCEEYGAFSVRSKAYVAHRFSYERHKGVIPEGKIVMHHCDNTFCVNPSHLSAVEQSVNIADKVSKGRQAVGSGHGMAKLTEDDVRAIRASGLSLSKIAAQYGITKTMVSYIKRRQNWKHI